MIKYLAILIIVFLSISSIADENTWSTRGPYSARVTAIAIDPGNSNCIFIGTVENGIYYTENDGEYWNHIDSELLPRTIRKIVFNPQHPDTMWAATTESCYKSFNHGVDWERVVFPAGWHYEINALAIHPRWTNIIFVGGPWFSGINYVSYDAGETCERLSLTQIVAENFVIDPVNDSTIYATSHTATTRKSVYKSIDLGATWTSTHNDLDTTTTIYDLALDPVDINIIYVCGRDRTSSGKCVYKSENGGLNWLDISPEELLSDWIFNIYVSPQNHNTVFICTEANGVLKSLDAGNTWVEANSGLPTRYAYRIIYDTETDVYYLGTLWDGIYRSSTGGDSWEKISYNIPNANCVDFALKPDEPAIQFVCTKNGFYKTTDSGHSWEFNDLLSPDYNRATTCMAIDPLNTDIIFVGASSYYNSINNCSVFRSQDSGISWEGLNNGLPGSCWFGEMRIGHYPGRNTVFLGTEDNGLYKSDDNGETWYRDINMPEELCIALDISQVDNDYVYVGGYNAYGSTDGGEHWHELNTPEISDGYINEIVSYPNSPEELFMCVFDNGLYKSVDAGESWIDLTDNLPYNGNYILFSGIAINPQNPDNVYIYSFDYGIFQSHDGGDTWEPFYEGFNIHCGMTTTIIDPSDTNRIYTATLEQSVWSITRTPTGIDDGQQPLPSQVSLSAYPNPFNAAANISFSLPTASNVSLDIYDLLGRRTASLLDSYLPAGNHSLLWHPEDLAAGVYIYRLTTDNNQTSHKITFLK